MRSMTKVESRNRQSKLEGMTPDARAWVYDREIEARKQGDDAWDSFLNAEYGQPQLLAARPKRR
jgi:hypothetical protein